MNGHRRALANGAVSAVATAAIGFAVVALIGGEAGEPAARTSPTATVSPPPVCAPVYEVLPTEDPSDAGNLLLSVAAIAPNDAWAVGGAGILGNDPVDDTSQLLIEHWDGSTWVSTDPLGPGTASNTLRSVSAIGKRNVWAVGSTSDGSGFGPLILHFDGTQWLQSSAPTDLAAAELYGVSADASDDVWAVGTSVDRLGSGFERAIALHFDGGTWTSTEILPAVGDGRSGLLSVSALSPDDVWAVGYHHNRPLILHFDGQAWSQNAIDSKGSLWAALDVGIGDAWAAGTTIQHFDGAAWAERGAIRSDGILRGAADVAPNDIWAVGFKERRASAESKALVMRWNGTRWFLLKGQPIPGQERLVSVSALPDGTVLAVGSRTSKSGVSTLAVRGVDCPPVA